MDAVPMIRDCYQHQWPEEYGREMVPFVTHTELDWRWPRESVGMDFGVYTPTYCHRCECDHGPVPDATFAP